MNYCRYPKAHHPFSSFSDDEDFYFHFFFFTSLGSLFFFLSLVHSLISSFKKSGVFLTTGKQKNFAVVHTSLDCFTQCFLNCVCIPTGNDCLQAHMKKNTTHMGSIFKGITPPPKYYIYLHASIYTCKHKRS